MSHLEGAQLAPELHAGGAPGGQARQLRRGVPLRQLGPGRLRRRCAENGRHTVSGTEPTHKEGQCNAMTAVCAVAVPSAHSFRQRHTYACSRNSSRNSETKRAGTSPVNTVVRETIMERQVRFQPGD